MKRTPLFWTLKGQKGTGDTRKEGDREGEAVTMQKEDMTYCLRWQFLVFRLFIA